MASLHRADHHDNSDKTICLSVWLSTIHTKSGTIQSDTNRCRTKSSRRMRFDRTGSMLAHLDRWSLRIVSALDFVYGLHFDCWCRRSLNCCRLRGGEKKWKINFRPKKKPNKRANNGEEPLTIRSIVCASRCSLPLLTSILTAIVATTTAIGI